MKNTIFKSYMKKILKSEAFVSVIIVFVLALGIIGSSYALYMDIDTDTNYQLVEVGDLAIGFNNGSDIIELTNMTPTSDDIAINQNDNLTSFYIYNEGTYTAKYKIKLASTDGNEVKTKYINYQICRDNSNNCKDIGTLNESGDTIIYTDELTPNSTALDINNTYPSAYYYVRLWLNDLYTDISTTKTIKLQIKVEATNASGYLDNDNTLAGKILSNPNITINNNEPIFNGIADYKVTGDSTSGELGLFKAEDDYGVSYYFRGAQSNNYVNFAGFTWRIVRINGDGSVRLILDGILNNVKINGTAVGPITAFNPSNSDNAYVGYMYGLAGTTTDASRCLVLENGTVTNKVSEYTTETDCEGSGGEWVTSAYEATHANIKSSTIKVNVDTFYETYITSTYTKTNGNIVTNASNVDSKGIGYENYLADVIFCGDKTLGYSGNGLSNNTTYYSPYDRLYKSRTISTPTLMCASGANINFSRYTVNEQTINGVSTNGDLKYPIALLSADELLMAGAFKGTKNTSYYLYDAVKNGTLSGSWWTMSALGQGRNNSFVFSSDPSDNSLHGCEPSDMYGFCGNSASTLGIRPVINLRSDVLWASGNGTSTSPYTVKLY